MQVYNAKSYSRRFIEMLDAVNDEGARARLPHWDRGTYIKGFPNPDEQFVLAIGVYRGFELSSPNWTPSSSEQISDDWEIEHFEERCLNLLLRRLRKSRWLITHASWRGSDSYHVHWRTGRDEIKAEAFERMRRFVRHVRTTMNPAGVEITVYRARKNHFASEIHEQEEGTNKDE